MLRMFVSKAGRVLKYGELLTSKHLLDSKSTIKTIKKRSLMSFCCLKYLTPFPIFSNAHFEQVNVCWKQQDSKVFLRIPH